MTAPSPGGAVFVGALRMIAKGRSRWLTGKPDESMQSYDPPFSLDAGPGPVLSYAHLISAGSRDPVTSSTVLPSPDWILFSPVFILRHDKKFGDEVLMMAQARKSLVLNTNSLTNHQDN